MNQKQILGTPEFGCVEEMTLIEFKDTFIFEPLKPAGIQQHLVLHRTTHVFFLYGMINMWMTKI
jgi:hypothetical protein